MAELLKRTFPVPADAIICCGQCNAELWKTKQSITGLPIAVGMFETHIRQAPKEGDIIACPVCHALIPSPTGHVHWKLPTRFP